MRKFKVGDKVAVVAGKVNAGFMDLLRSALGVREYHTITYTSAEGYWLQLDGMVCYGDPVPWCSEYFELYQEPDDELPPVPDEVAYMNSKRDSGNDQRLVLKKDHENYEGLMYIGVIPRKGSSRAQAEIGINIDPDSALQLAHDIRRMAMYIKRKEKAQ